MELTRQSISNHSRLIPGIEGYLTLIDKIEENKSIHPDIAIETCKSLLEGLCLKGLSLLSDKYNGSKSLRTKCKNDLKVLTNTAFDEVYTDYVESQVHESLANMLIDVSVAKKIKDNAKRKVKEQAIEVVAKVSAIRNERGDISHGRDYPKTQESSIILSKSISSITDGICSFMIEQIAEKYSLKLKTQDRLIYEELTDFNDWLDETHHVSSIKVDFSKIIYKNAYDKYEEYYYSEYMEFVEVNDQGKDQTNEAKMATSDDINDGQKEITEKKIILDQPKLKFDPDKIVVLTSDYDSDEFWTNERKAAVDEFIEQNDLQRDVFIPMLEDKIAFNKNPIRSDLAQALKTRLRLKEYEIVLGPIIADLDALAYQLKNELK